MMFACFDQRVNFVLSRCLINGFCLFGIHSLGAIFLDLGHGFSKDFICHVILNEVIF